MARLVAHVLETRYGVDAAPVLAAAGIDTGDLGAAGARCTYAQMQALWPQAAAAAGDPGFALRVGASVKPATLGVLGVAWVASRTLRDALARVCRYTFVLSTAPYDLVMTPEGDATALVLQAAGQPGPAARFSVDALFAAMTALARLVGRDGLRPAWVELQHDDAGMAGVYAEVFGTAVRFGSARNALAFGNADLDAILVGHAEDIAAANDALAEQFVRSAAAGPATLAVRRLVAALLPSGTATIEAVAARLGRGVSTLQRQLQLEGTSFRALVEQSRRELAEGYLADPRLSLADTAYLIGFGNSSSFSRAYRRWTGHSPRQARQARARKTTRHSQPPLEHS